jgi:glycosyltransferase involved in cell wall biosynthesis
MSDVQIYVTGNYKRAKIVPEEYKEVKFTGFVPQVEYVKLLNSVDAIMTLTTRENTMQRGGSEAISVAKPLITSNTFMLKEYFISGTVFVDNNTKSIIEGVKELRNNYQNYSNGILEMREKRKNSFEDSIKIIEQKLLGDVK